MRSVGFYLILALLSCVKKAEEKLPNNIDFTNTIIFASVRSQNILSNPQIYAVKVDSPHTVYQLSKTRYLLRSPVWLPDGSGIMFLSIRFDSYPLKDGSVDSSDEPDIYVMDTSGVRLLVPSWGNFNSEYRKKYEILNGYISKPIPTSDNKVIYGLVGGRPELIIWDISKPEIFFEYLDNSSIGVAELTDFALSSDEKKIAFVSTPKKNPSSPDFLHSTPDSISNANYFGSQREISIVSIDGTGYKRLTENKLPDGNPCWSKDGKKIYFSRFREWTIKKRPEGAEKFKRDIYVIDTNGIEAENLTDSPNTDDYCPEVSPDGKRVAYISKTEESNCAEEIWIMNSDGSNKRCIYKSGLTAYRLSWYPKEPQ